MANRDKGGFVKDDAGEATEMDSYGSESEDKFSPLAIPLDKNTMPGDKEPAPKRITQKEFLSKIFTRMDQKLDRRVGAAITMPRFVKVLLLLFIAPFIILTAADIYKGWIQPSLAQFGLGAAPQPASPGVKTEADNLQAVLKQNEALVKKLATQNRELSKKLSSLIDLQKKQLKKEPFKVIVIPGNGTETFSFKQEKKRLYEISGLDIDDPVSEKTIGKVKSTEVLLAMIGSFNRILLNSDHKSVSEFHLKNTAKAKRLTLKILRQLK